MCKLGLAGLLIVSGTFAGCQQPDPAPLTLSRSARPAQQMSQQELVQHMAADPLVQDFIYANEAYLTRYDQWRASLSPTERATHRAQVRAAAQQGKSLPEVFRTEAQVAAYRRAQEERARQIRAKYPQLTQLSAAKEEEVKRLVYRAVMPPRASEIPD